MATEFDRASLQHVAELAALTLSAEETDGLAADLKRILAYVDELETVDTTDVEPTTTMTDPRTASTLRPDAPEPSLDRAAVLAQAPRATENGFLVPTFVES